MSAGQRVRSNPNEGRTNDMADGSGSNSQWGTTFDLFYDDADGLHFNWGPGDIDISVDDPQPRPNWFDNNEGSAPSRRTRMVHLRRPTDPAATARADQGRC